MLASAEISIPSAPLGVTMSATPMALLVASKDHKLFFEAYNDASDIDNDGILDIRFKPSITYYGLFDSNVCYTHSSNLFSPASAATNGKCSGQWSGNWLNYVTTSRIDALRKVLYGGYREIDSATETILRRAYIPQDGHSWAKEYTSPAIDGYSISDYTPLSSPAANKRHFFGNLTPNENTNCSTLNTCSNLLPLLSVVTNSTKRVWAWASKERPVLDGSHGGTRNDYAVRVKVCTANFHEGCKQYPNGNYKPTGLLHDYGEDETMLFGLLTGSYNKNMSGGMLRKVVSSFKNEVNLETGVFTSDNIIVQNLDNLRIRDFNNGKTDASYRNGSFRTGVMEEGKYVDWGNPVAEMMYEGLRYFAGKSAATLAYSTTGSYDADVGLTVATWDNPYSNSSSAKSLWCSKPNMIVMSDINPSYDSDQVPGTAFGSFSGDVSGLNAQNLASTITENENIEGNYFIGQSNSSNNDGAPTPKAVTSLGTVRGLAPEEPTKQGSYYSASVAYFGKTEDLNAVQGDQNIDSYYVALASPLPKIEIPVNGKTISLVPFAKTIDGYSTVRTKGAYQPTNPIVDFYVDTIANTNSDNIDVSVNNGRPYYKFIINYEADEQGNDFDMDVISEYEIQLEPNNELLIKVKITYESTGSNQNVGYVISGTNRDGVYLVVQDKNEELDYFLNVPPGQNPGYCDTSPVPNLCKKLPYFDDSKTPNTVMTSEQRFQAGTGQAATLLKDPLWYAAKWGGFIDKNDNDLPDLDYEWDANNDGVPDTYFLVQNPLKLEEALKRALDNIVDRTASASNVTSNSMQLNTDTFVFKSIFNSVSWSGNLLAYTIDSITDAIDLPSWRASENVPVPSARRIFITGSNGETTAFSWSNLSASDKTALINEDVLNYLRGSRSDEQQNGGTLRDRAYSNVLGDFVHSSPVYVKDTETVYLGGNDGMLHAFDTSDGTELFAYIPSAVINKLEQITRVNYNHQYFVDGEIVVSDQSQTNDSNYLVAALGHGGKGLFALDVTNPESFSSSDVKWSYFDTSDDDLGYMIGRPVIAKMNNGDWAVIVGNGYNSTDGKAVLYIFDLVSGDLLQKIDTDVSGDNGLASPGIYDADYDGVVDFIYAGDLKGNVWKFNVTSENKNSWGSALRQGSKAKPLFTATDPSGNPQPITAQITIVPNHNRADAINYGNRFIFFGTGSYFRASDPNDEQIQSWYGLIDENAQIGGRSALIQRSIYQTGAFDGKPVRTFNEATLGDMSGKKGWYIDFNIEAGERIVTSSKYEEFVEPVLVASSIIPIEDPCIAGGKGYVNAISPFTGGRLIYGIFDVNDNENFDDDKLNNIFIGSVDLGIGMPSEPIILLSEDPSEPSELILSGTSSGYGDTGGGGYTPPPNNTSGIGALPLPPKPQESKKTGRSSWREIITE
ncbi:type IV pilus assembly protein PilY1 [Allochromatium warmingii]|uniref:Type IV pilus assembly protein PilY1 n=2 Tax=Allochromatium warmingii TaxID=61595 RepID=A0A1H3DGU0_ALLWA|nr:type IV pilus assembly protein PilY1 [Allochromatium warmingii]